MNEALLAICENGQASDLAAFAVSENRRALLLDMTPNTPNTSRYLTSDFKATTPGDFYYAICTTAKVKELKVCEYETFKSEAHRIIFERIVLNVIIRDIRTGGEVGSIFIYGSKLPFSFMQDNLKYGITSSPSSFSMGLHVCPPNIIFAC